MVSYFRPSDVAVGIDGAIYIADWYDPIVGDHAMRDNAAHGRILRLAPKGSRTVPPRIDLTHVSGQIAALCNPAINVRNAAFEKLQKLGPDAITPLTRLFEGDNPRWRARALFLLYDAIQEKALQDKDPDIRITAYRILRRRFEQIQQARAASGTNSPGALADTWNDLTEKFWKNARLLGRDSVAAVRREVALSLRDLSVIECKPVLLDLATGYDGKDRWYLEAFGIGCDGKEEAIYPALLDRFGRTGPLGRSLDDIALGGRVGRDRIRLPVDEDDPLNVGHHRTLRSA
jgi:hypothetical protein